MARPSATTRPREFARYPIAPATYTIARLPGCPGIRVESTRPIAIGVVALRSVHPMSHVYAQHQQHPPHHRRPPLQQRAPMLDPCRDRRTLPMGEIEITRWHRSLPRSSRLPSTHAIRKSNSAQPVVSEQTTTGDARAASRFAVTRRPQSRWRGAGTAPRPAPHVVPTALPLRQRQDYMTRTAQTPITGAAVVHAENVLASRPLHQPTNAMM